MDRCFGNNAVLLFEVAFVYREYRLRIDIVVFEYAVDQIRCKLFVSLVGYIFDKISYLFAHLLRQTDTEALFQDIVYTAFSGLAVDSDYVRIISSANILRIDRKIRNAPFIQVMLFSPCHSFCDRILMEPENAVNTSSPAYG